MFTKEKKFRGLFALMLVLALTLSCAGLAFAADARETKSLSDIYEENVNACVGITTSVTTNYYGYTTKRAVSGSGFIISEDGYIVTNYHVVEDSDTITVTTYDDKSYSATFIGGDESNDIAVLKIDAEGLQAVTLGDSDVLRVGDTVAAIGNPLGELTFSLTMGIVSAKDREITFSSGRTMTLIQTDTAINSGNSGGPLFNEYGEVVGITNAKYSSNGMGGTVSIENICFAIPINLVRGMIESLVENGYIVKPYVGVIVSNVSDELQSYGIPAGASIQAVNEDSPAEAAGLKEKDIITAANDTEIHSSSDLVSFVSNCRPGDEITLQVYRAGESEQLSLVITIGEKQQEATVKSEAEEGSQQLPDYGQGQNGNGSFEFSFPFSFIG